MPVDPQAIGLLAAQRRDLFPCPTQLPRPTVPRPFRVGFMRSCRRSPTESLYRPFCPLLSKRAVLPWVPSLFATLTKGVYSVRELPRLPLRSALRLSQPLGGLLHLRLRGFISSRSHVQGFPSVQGFLPIHSRPDSSPGHASMPLSTFRSPASRLPRLIASASRLCSVNRSVPRGGV
jgi:hypothetical protein